MNPFQSLCVPNRIICFLFFGMCFYLGFSQTKEEKFLKQFETANTEALKYAAADTLMYIYKGSSDRDSYAKYAKEFLTLAEKRKDYNRFIEVSLNLLSYYRTDKTGLVAVDTIVRNTEKYLKYTKDQYLIATTYKKRAGIFFTKGIHDSATVYYTKAIDTYKDSDSIYKADAIFFRGQAYERMKENLKAIEDFKLAKQYYRNLGDFEYVSYVTNGEIIIYSSNGLIDKAIQERLELIESLKETDFNLKGEYYNLAIDYKKVGDKRAQLIYLLKALEQKEASDYLDQSNISIYSSLVSLYAEKDDKVNATKYLDALNKLDFPNVIFTLQMEIWQARAVYHLQFGSSVKALDIIHTAFDKSKDVRSVEIISEFHKLAHKVHTKLGNYQKALDYFKAYTAINDSINSVKKANALSYYQTLYEVEQQQQKFDLEKSAQEKVIQEQQNSKKAQFWSFLVILILLIVILLYVYLSRKKLKKQKTLIEDALEEKKLLLKEIHHRVKNNLQIVTSLLNIQANGTKDKKILKSIKEGQNRVQIMGLLHKNLYQSEQMSNIDVKKYVTELLQYLKSAFIGASKKIEIHIDIEEILFDFDTAIPLGLIINELVSNAFNHGFPEDREGTIWVKIEAQNQIDYELTVRNDGVKLPDDFDVKPRNSMGVNLVQSLSRQLRGELHISQTDDKTSFVVLFKDLKYYKLAILN